MKARGGPSFCHLQTEGLIGYLGIHASAFRNAWDTAGTPWAAVPTYTEQGLAPLGPSGPLATLAPAAAPTGHTRPAPGPWHRQPLCLEAAPPETSQAPFSLPAGLRVQVAHVLGSSHEHPKIKTRRSLPRPLPQWHCEPQHTDTLCLLVLSAASSLPSSTRAGNMGPSGSPPHRAGTSP